MTERQEFIIEKAKEKIRELRAMLDDVMYRTDGLSKEEHYKVRQAYDKICEANNKL
jgi:hypothetical protein